MKSFLVKIVVFTILFVGVNIIYLNIIKNFDFNFKKRIEALNLESPKYDILILGNSLAMDGIDTRYLNKKGLRSYNLAIGGSSLKTNYIQLKEYLNTYEHKPKVVVLGLGSYINSFTGNSIHPVVEYTNNNYAPDIEYIPMLKFKWMFKELLKRVVSKTHREAFLDYGQLKFKKMVSDNTSINFKNRFPIEKYKKSNILKDIIQLCTANEIQLFIVEMPGFKSVRHKKCFDYYILDDAKMNGVILDFNYFEFCKIFDDDTDWIGNSHLNMFGAKKFTKELLNRLSWYERTTKPIRNAGFIVN